jgi:cell division protein YceG involved in septum cleavage
VNDTPDDLDPFRAGDPRAAEREARRREREARRRARSEGSRRSLADRVEDAAPPGGTHLPGQPIEPPAQPQGAAPDEELPAAEDPPAPEDLAAPEVPAPAEPAQADSGWITPITDRASAWVSRVRGGSGATAVDRRTIMVRRGAAGAALLVGLLLVFLAMQAIGGGEEAEPVAAPEPIETVDVVVPEGLTIEQIARVAKKAKLKGSYGKAAKQAIKGFPLKRYEAGDAPSLEGFLFPATYELEKRAPARDLVAKQLEAFERNFADVDLKAARKKNLTPYDVLIIASMVEEEVQIAKERPMVAAVIYNRLAAGDTLGIDATLRYELGKYDGQLLQSELDAPTPYNSRLTPGLPPTPIANPGLAAIEAAANPAKTDAYYFVIKPGTCNEHFFTADEAEFQAAQARYQEALAAEGGSPTDCP